VTIVRIVVAQRGWVPADSGRNGEHLVVLAEDEGHRAVPLWLHVREGKELIGLLLRWAAGEPVMPGAWPETAARLLDAAGAAVTAVDIDPADADVPELSPDTVTARVELATGAGARHALVSAAYGLALAAVTGAPVRVADAVMDRLAVPVQGEDALAPFLLPAPRRPPASPGQRWRFEPRNLAFTDGLDYWELAGSFLAAGQPHWQDYSCTAEGRSAVLASAVPEPSGFAALVQTIHADDYRAGTVTFRGQLRTTGVVGRAGLHLATDEPDEPAGAAPVSGDWTWHEVTMPVPAGADAIRFGISLTGRGRVELRNAELSPARPEAGE
jgi:bifunctional DNase/RNase